MAQVWNTCCWNTIQPLTSSCFKPKEPVSLFKTCSLHRLFCSLTGGVHELLWYCAGLHPHGCFWGSGEPSLLGAGCAAQPLAVRQLQGDGEWHREAALSVTPVPRPGKSRASSFPAELNSLFIIATLSWSSKQQPSCAWKLFTGKLSLFWEHLAANQTYGSRGFYQWCHGDVKRWQHLFLWMRIKGAQCRGKYVGFSMWPFILAVPQQALKLKLQSFPLVLPPSCIFKTD